MGDEKRDFTGWCQELELTEEERSYLRRRFAADMVNVFAVAKDLREGKDG